MEIFNRRLKEVEYREIELLRMLISAMNEYTCRANDFGTLAGSENGISEERAPKSFTLSTPIYSQACEQHTWNGIGTMPTKRLRNVIPPDCSST